MHDRRVTGVQVEQSPHYVHKQGLFEGEREARGTLQQIIQVAVQPLHHQHWQCGPFQETQSQELHHMRVSHLCHYLQWFTMCVRIVLIVVIQPLCQLSVAAQQCFSAHSGISGMSKYIPGALSAADILRPVVYYLYGKQKGYCNGCGSHFEMRNFHVDHIVPTKKGGPDVDENLQLLCGHCNSVKGDRDMEYLMAKLESQK